MGPLPDEFLLHSIRGHLGDGCCFFGGVGGEAELCLDTERTACTCLGTTAAAGGDVTLGASFLTGEEDAGAGVGFEVRLGDALDVEGAGAGFTGAMASKGETKSKMDLLVDSCGGEVIGGETTGAGPGCVITGSVRGRTSAGGGGDLRAFRRDVRRDWSLSVARSLLGRLASGVVDELSMPKSLERWLGTCC